MAKTRDYEFIINGMTCSGCIDTVRHAAESALEKAIREKISPSEKAPLKFIKHCAVALPNELTLSLQEECPLTVKEIQDTLSSSLEELSYGCALIEKPDPAIIRNHVIKGIIGLAAGLGLMIGMMLAMMLGLGIPLFLLPIAPAIPYIIGGISTALTLFLGYETYIDAGKKLFLTKKLNMNALFTVSTLTAIGASIAALFVSALEMLFDSALLIFAFRHFGIAIEESAKQKVYSGLKFRQRAAKKVRKIFDAKSGTECDVECSSVDLIEGDIIYVSHKQIIPTDGVCILDKENPSALIYDSINSGASVPRLFKHDETILAGMEVLNGANKIKMRVTATENNSNLAKLDRSIVQGQSDEERKAPIQTTADKILKYFIPGVIALAIAAFITVGFVFAGPLTVFAWPLALKVLILILSSACPCTFGSIVPSGVRIGMTKAAKHGVLFKSGESLQAADDIKVVALDVNGTLTTGEIKVVKFSPLRDEHDDVLNIIEALEQESAHPFAVALQSFSKKNIKNKSTLKPLAVSELKDFHSGRQAKINGDIYTIGDKAAMEKLGIDTRSFADLYNDEDTEHVIFLARNNNIISHLSLHSPLRDDAKETVRKLQQQGKEVCLISGATKETVFKIAKKVGISLDDDHIKAQCISQEPKDGVIPDNHKIHHIREFQKKYGKVAMVGDGSNDARVIRDGLLDKEKEGYCDLGIAIQSTSGSLITQQNASVIIGNHSLSPLATLFIVATQTVSNIKLNLLLSLGQNFLTMALIAGLLIGLNFVLPPPIGAALMVLGACVILLSLYIFKNQKVAGTDMHPISKAETDVEALELTTTAIRKKLEITPTPVIDLTAKTPIESGKDSSSTKTLDLRVAKEEPLYSRAATYFSLR